MTTSSDATRLSRYFEWVDALRARVVPCAAVALAYRTNALSLRATAMHDR
jgi:hypothetical protein